MRVITTPHVAQPSTPILSEQHLTRWPSFLLVCRAHDLASVPSVALLQSLLILQWSFVGSQAHRKAMAQHNAELLQSAQKINEDLHDMCWGKQGCCWSLWGAICSGLTSCCQSIPAPEAGVRTDNESIRTKLLSGTGQGTESDKMKELCVGRIMALNNRDEAAARQFDLCSLAPTICLVIGGTHIQHITRYRTQHDPSRVLRGADARGCGRSDVS